MSKFWEGTHKDMALYKKLYEKYIPMSGASNCVEGELLRAANRIAYECYNNGFCNNKSQEFAYLSNYFNGSEFFKEALEVIRPYVCCGFGQVDFKDESLNNAIDTIIEQTLHNLNDYDQGLSEKTFITIEDMSSLPDDEYPDVYDEDDY
jgi:hypothetical protein